MKKNFFKIIKREKKKTTTNSLKTQIFIYIYLLRFVVSVAVVIFVVGSLSSFEKNCDDGDERRRNEIFLFFF